MQAAQSSYAVARQRRGKPRRRRAREQLAFQPALLALQVEICASPQPIFAKYRRAIEGLRRFLEG